MPPRRPGGKYKGAISRAKGEETLLEESERRRQEALEEHIARMEAKRMEGGKKASEEFLKLQHEKREALKQKYASMFHMGRKGRFQKCFRAWLVGMHIYKKERIVMERDIAWRKSCACSDADCRGGCTTHMRLRDVGYQLPTDAALKSGGFFSALAGRLSFGGAQPLTLPSLVDGSGPRAQIGGLIAAPGRTFVDPFGARSARPRPENDAAFGGLSGQRSRSAAALLSRPASVATQPDDRGEQCRGLAAPSGWPATGGRARTSSTPRPPSP